mmetsp:Transcript_89640/g.240424  ORF Transcript_89640/g.240424 Transcript_89640/m.240424 type:complete len:349 (-) Transcript_89640:1993-3039(-)
MKHVGDGDGRQALGNGGQAKIDNFHLALVQNLDRARRSCDRGEGPLEVPFLVSNARKLLRVFLFSHGRRCQVPGRGLARLRIRGFRRQGQELGLHLVKLKLKAADPGHNKPKIGVLQREILERDQQSESQIADLHGLVGDALLLFAPACRLRVSPLQNIRRAEDPRYGPLLLRQILLAVQLRLRHPRPRLRETATNHLEVDVLQHGHHHLFGVALSEGQEEPEGVHAELEVQRGAGARVLHEFGCVTAEHLVSERKHPPPLRHHLLVQHVLPLAHVRQRAQRLARQHHRESLRLLRLCQIAEQYVLRAEQHAHGAVHQVAGHLKPRLLPAKILSSGEATVAQGLEQAE